MRDGWGDKAQTLDCGRGFAGQADYQGPIHHDSQAARKDGIGSELHGFGAHNFAEAGQFPHGNFAHRLGCYIS